MAAAKPLPSWAKPYTKQQALAAACRLLGSDALVWIDTCGPLTRGGEVVACSAVGAHSEACRGNPARPVYMLGINLGIARSVRGAGASWPHALARAAFQVHRDRCSICGAKRKCQEGKPLLRAITEATPPDGLIQCRIARETGLLVSVYHSAEAHLETDPALPYATVCEEHGGIVCHATKADALGWASQPKTWCPTCKGEVMDPYKDG